MDPLALAIAAIASALGIIATLVKIVGDKRRRESERPPPQRETLPSVDPLANTGQHPAVAEITGAVSEIRQVSHHLRGLPTREDVQALERSLEQHANRLERVAWDLEAMQRAHAAVRDRVQDHQLRLDDHGQRIAGIELHLGEPGAQQ